MHATIEETNETAKVTPVALRAHTILGVCEAIGEDFGFNPIWIRIPFAASVLVSPLWSVVAYLALGVVVLASRLVFPARSKALAGGANLGTAASSEAAEKSNDNGDYKIAA